MKNLPDKIRIEKASVIFSLLTHLFIAVLVFVFYSFMPGDNNLIEIGYGEPGGGSGGFGPLDKNISMIALPAKPETEPVPASEELKPSENVPEVSSSNKDDENISMKLSKEKTEKVKISKTSPDKFESAGNNKNGTGIGNGTGTGRGIGSGNGNGMGDGLGDGFGIDWGGRVRKIYNYIIPSYPEGVTKEIDVKLRFSIMPDGTVGNIIVIKKADNRLEQVAIEALRLWRFEPLPRNSRQEQQITIITFPFRLN